MLNEYGTSEVGVERCGPTFPNGKSKTYLYESHLQHSDFDCEPYKYAEEIAVVRRLEQENRDRKKKRQKELDTCAWRQDVDGRFIVTQLNLTNPYVRVEITDIGFRTIPTATARSKAALKECARTVRQLKALFSPLAAIDQPLNFAGRTAQIQQVFQFDLARGGLILIVGERSVGKTSLVHMLHQIYDGNVELLGYYDLQPYLGGERYRTVCADVSGGLRRIDTLATKLRDGLGFKSTDEDAVLSATNSINYLQGAGEHPVLLLDEFDCFQETEALAPTLRNWISNGLICILVGSERTFHSLVNGHISLARAVNRIEVGPMSKEEFKEIFYLAAARSSDAIQFDSGALSALYDAAQGLPYFGQLFGSILLEVVARRLGGFEKILAAGQRSQPILIQRIHVQEIIGNLPKRCHQLEVQAKLLEAHLPEGRKRLTEIASGGYCSSGRRSAPAGWCARVPMLGKHLTVEGPNVRITDPVLRQYALLTRASK